MSRESSFYSVEKATWALDLAHEVLTVAYTAVRPKHQELVVWARSSEHVPAMFDRMRTGEQ